MHIRRHQQFQLVEVLSNEQTHSNAQSVYITNIAAVDLF